MEKPNNPLSKNGMIATPESMEALQDYIASLSMSNERTAATVCAGMAWNLAVDIVQEYIDAGLLKK